LARLPADYMYGLLRVSNGRHARAAPRHPW
jgi:hypothetical protein